MKTFKSSKGTVFKYNPATGQNSEVVISVDQTSVKLRFGEIHEFINSLLREVMVEVVQRCDAEELGSLFNKTISKKEK